MRHPEDWDSELFIKDSGKYEGDPDKIVGDNEDHQPSMKSFISWAKNHQESFHTRLKSFNILVGCRFHHGANTKDKLRIALNHLDLCRIIAM